MFIAFQSFNLVSDWYSSPYLIGDIEDEAVAPATRFSVYSWFLNAYSRIDTSYCTPWKKISLLDQ